MRSLAFVTCLQHHIPRVRVYQKSETVLGGTAIRGTFRRVTHTDGPHPCEEWDLLERIKPKGRLSTGVIILLALGSPIWLSLGTVNS